MTIGSTEPLDGFKLGKSLVIVESPAKAKTINRYLGKDYVVRSSVGHIRDLPDGSQSSTSAPAERAREAAKVRKLPLEERLKHRRAKTKARQIARMGVDPENNWQARYQVVAGKEKVVQELRRLALGSDHIYLATDRDREGEAIAWHLREVIGGDHDRYRRVLFNEITRKAITEAFDQPTELNMARVQAQQARRFLDRVVGFMGSPLLWEKVARSLSMGRVQSVAVRLIVQREREIRAFVPEEYWEVFADLVQKSAEPVRMQVIRQKGKAFRPGNQTQVDAAMALLREAEYVLQERKTRPIRRSPGAPFITSTLQQWASNRLGFSVKKTMMLAQRLYEAGLITYMRTDSTNLSQEAVNQCRDLVSSSFGDRYVPGRQPVYTSKGGAQEAHEAIRPSDVARQAGQLSGLDADQRRLYDLIWRKFVASQMSPAEYLSTTLEVTAGDFELRVRGRIMQFDGFTRVLPGKEDDTILPDWQAGDLLTLKVLEPFQHFTKPPARYNEASLVSELEKRGIGRPSTYVSIISTIQDRGYASLKNKRFYAEKIGEVVTDRLVENFNDLMDYGFTAELEVALDRVSSGEADWESVLNTFYKGFSSKLEKAQEDETGMRGNPPVEVSLQCRLCGRPMCIRNSGKGVFLGCSGYSLSPKERCKGTLNLIPGNEVISVDADDEEESRLLRERERCPRCNTAMDGYLVDETCKLHVCGNNPDCLGFSLEEGRFRIKGYDGPLIECDKCGAEMQLKSGRFGKYFGCVNEQCKNTRKQLRNGEPAPPKADPVPMPELRCAKVDDHYVLRDGASGIFLAASQFPKKRETRAPYVDELIPHQNEIDPKHQYLLAAPRQDQAGNRTQIRYSRKMGKQYVMTEAAGKATGWRASYEAGRWVESASESGKTTTRKPKPKTKRVVSKTRRKTGGGKSA